MSPCARSSMMTTTKMATRTHVLVAIDFFLEGKTSNGNAHPIPLFVVYLQRDPETKKSKSNPARQRNAWRADALDNHDKSAFLECTAWSCWWLRCAVYNHVTNDAPHMPASKPCAILHVCCGNVVLHDGGISVLAAEPQGPQRAVGLEHAAVHQQC